MQRSKNLVAALIASILFLSGCDSTNTAKVVTSKERHYGAQRFLKIKQLASQSCMCRLVGMPSTEVDQRLSLATSGLKIEIYGESSAPLAGYYECFPELGENACISTYYFVSAPEDPRICKLEQLKRLKDALKSVPPLVDPKADAANEAMLIELLKIKADVKKSMPAHACR